MAESKRGRGRGRHRRRSGRPRDQGLPASLEAARALARRRFRIERLHPEQELAIESVLAGRDTVAVLPTGYGKSLIYQLPALLADRPTLVISPLIALMRDQEHALQRRGAPVVRLDSTLRAAERRDALARIRQGGRLIVLTTPETVESQAGHEALEAARPALLCVDEAHCISEWGHDFRPGYLRLGAERQALAVPTVLALTATATPRVQRDVADRLGMKDPVFVRAPPHRANLRLEVELSPGSRKQELAGALIRRLERPGIVYCATTKAVDEVYGALLRARIPAVRYHGKMADADRNGAERRYMKSGKRLVMVATTAFGMGIDKPDIRYILHYQTPGSLEQYVQEAGRAGRDGKPSRCILLFDPADIDIQVFLQSQGRPSPAQLRRVGYALEAWVREGRPVDNKALALSASTFQTTTRAMCAELEHLGLIGLDAEKRWVSLVEPDALRSGIESLAGSFETLRREDERRRGAVVAYAETEDCRSVFIRKWFGEDEPPRCGVCDRCRAVLELDRTSAAAGRKARAEASPDEPSPKKRRRRRRKKPGSGEALPAGARPEQPERGAPPVGGPAELAPPSSRRRRRRRRKGRGAGGEAERPHGVAVAPPSGAPTARPAGDQGPSERQDRDGAPTARPAGDHGPSERLGEGGEGRSRSSRRRRGRRRRRGGAPLQGPPPMGQQNVEGLPAGSRPPVPPPAPEQPFEQTARRRRRRRSRPELPGVVDGQPTGARPALAPPIGDRPPPREETGPQPAQAGPRRRERFRQEPPPAGRRDADAPRAESQPPAASPTEPRGAEAPPAGPRPAPPPPAEQRSAGPAPASPRPPERLRAEPASEPPSTTRPPAPPPEGPPGPPSPGAPAERPSPEATPQRPSLEAPAERPSPEVTQKAPRKPRSPKAPAERPSPEATPEVPRKPRSPKAPAERPSPEATPEVPRKPRSTKAPAERPSPEATPEAPRKPRSPKAPAERPSPKAPRKPRSPKAPAEQPSPKEGPQKAPRKPRSPKAPAERPSPKAPRKPRSQEAPAERPSPKAPRKPRSTKAPPERPSPEATQKAPRKPRSTKAPAERPSPEATQKAPRKPRSTKAPAERPAPKPAPAGSRGRTSDKKK